MSKEMFDPAFVLLKEFYEAIENVPTIHQDGKYKKTQSDDLATSYDLEVKNGRFVNNAYISYADNRIESFPALKQIAVSFSEEGVLLYAKFRHADYSTLTGEKACYDGEHLKIEGDFASGIFTYTKDDMTFERHYAAEGFKKIKNPLEVVYAQQRAKKIRKRIAKLGAFAILSAPFVVGAIVSCHQKTPPQPAPQHQRG